jgi:hypothetical protein
MGKGENTKYIYRKLGKRGNIKREKGGFKGKSRKSA